MRKEERLGEARVMNCGEIAFIVEYVGYNNITVQFKTTGELVKTTYQNFKNCNVKSRFKPSAYSVGIIGNEKVRDENGKIIKSYSVWYNMLRRCNSDECQKKHPTYKCCTVCEEWLNYSNFKQWFDINHYEIEGESVQLDKDLLLKGNKVYCPKFCCFLPKIINEAIIDNKKKKNSKNVDIPIGVNPHGDKFQCSIRKYGKQYFIGTYNSIEEASKIYNTEKENYIKELADKYKKYITEESYNALKNYKIEKEVLK